jgi:hypothetical protein
LRGGYLTQINCLLAEGDISAIEYRLKARKPTSGVSFAARPGRQLRGAAQLQPSK